MALSSESADIMARLAKFSLPQTATVKREAADRKRKSRKRPTATPARSGEYGRRRMSFYQAKALGSGRGVLPARDATFTMSPQQEVDQDGLPAYWVSCGRSTITPGVYGVVHINFPEWVQ